MSCKRQKPCWNHMEELKYLICAIDSCKCPKPTSPVETKIVLPPRVQEIPCVSSCPSPSPCPSEIPPPVCQPSSKLCSSLCFSPTCCPTYY